MPNSFRNRTATTTRHLLQLDGQLGDGDGDGDDLQNWLSRSAHTARNWHGLYSRSLEQNVQRLAGLFLRQTNKIKKTNRPKTKMKKKTEKATTIKPKNTTEIAKNYILSFSICHVYFSFRCLCLILWQLINFNKYACPSLPISLPPPRSPFGQKYCFNCPPRSISQVAAICCHVLSSFWVAETNCVNAAIIDAEKSM